MSGDENLQRAYVEVDVEPGDASPDGVQLRFRCAGPSRPIERILYESDEGESGWWRVAAATNDPARPTSFAMATPVQDSSEGTVLLVSGARGGLRLQNESSGHVVREPYLVLRLETPAE